MTVNFNGVRESAVKEFDRLTVKLNSCIQKGGHYAELDGYDRVTCLDGFVVVDAQEIDRMMNNLRQLIGTIAMTYEENNKEFIDIFQKVYGDHGSMELFNDNED